MKKIAIVSLSIAVLLGASACGNTVRGVGEDIERAGNSIQKCC